MKIYNCVTLDKDDNVIYEDSYNYEGVIDKCGGGGASGTVGVPDYVQEVFKNLWDTWDGNDMDHTPTDKYVDVINAALTSGGGNPYDGDDAYDPSAALSLNIGSPLYTMQDGYDTFQALITALDHDVDWDAIITKAVSEIDTNLSWADINTAITTIVSTAITNAGTVITDMATQAASLLNSAAITAAVTAYEADLVPQHLRAVARLSAGYADINSVNSSAFIWGMALAQFELSKEVSKFRADLNLKAYEVGLRGYIEAYVAKLRAHMGSRMSFDNIRTQSILQSVTEMANQLRFKVQAQGQGTTMQADIGRLTISALKDQADQDIEIDAADAMWDLNLFVGAFNTISSIAGGIQGPTAPRPTKAQSAIGGTMSGAAMGLMTAAAIPSMGLSLVAGAVVGGIGGLLSSGIF